MTTITIQILKTNGHSAPGKLANAEIQRRSAKLRRMAMMGSCRSRYLVMREGPGATGGGTHGDGRS